MYIRSLETGVSKEIRGCWGWGMYVPLDELRELGLERDANPVELPLGHGGVGITRSDADQRARSGSGDGELVRCLILKEPTGGVSISPTGDRHEALPQRSSIDR